jgi:RHS repeat-associated protein
LADVNLYAPGGGERTFTGFDTNTQTFAPQQYDQTILKRTGDAVYELLSGNGSKLIFSQSDGAIGTSRKVFLTRILDSAGNAVTLTYDSDLRIVALIDAIGQVTTLSYGLTDDIYKVTKVTDPFGRSAIFDYEQVNTDWKFVPIDNCPVPSVEETPVRDQWLASITDVIGLTSRFNYFVKSNALGACAVCPSIPPIEACVSEDISLDFIASLITPYGTNHFQVQDLGNTRILEVAYPDGSIERVEYNQTNNIPPELDASVPLGMNHVNANLEFRNTYYWSRTASVLAYLDRSKARLYHWLHTEDLSTTSGCLESMKEPLEGRVWYDYAGQSSTIAIGPTTRPAHIGRVLDDGSTQLYTYGYNAFGKITNSIDPVGRTLAYLYATNGIDLLEIRQTRGANNELLFKATYNSQHRPLTVTDAAGQTTTYTYNVRGQLLTATNPRNETTTFTYDTNGYLLALDGPLPGMIDRVTVTYDAFGRVRTATSVSGDTYMLDYDNLDRFTRVTYPDTTFSEATYDRLSLAVVRDRAGRLTSFEHDNLGSVTKQTDPLGRVTLFDWCRCGALKSLTDAMGRTTSWTTDVQGRRTAKTYPDGTQVRYFYENTVSRLRLVIDEKQQTTSYTYNRDNSLRSIAYGNAAVATPSVTFTYDPNYLRPLSMTDGLGTTTYNYLPVTLPPALGAGNLASVDGPFANDTITYSYDELGRSVQAAINGVLTRFGFDEAGRITTESNALGAFNYSFDGGSSRVVSESYPNGQASSFIYGDGFHDRKLQQIANAIGPTPVSQFSYVRDIPAGRITSWSQQSGAGAPSVFNFGYDSANQLLSALVTNAGNLVNTFAYTYDQAGNRLTEQAGSSTYDATFNALNQISTTTAPVPGRTNEWDVANRLTAVNLGNTRTEFSYDGLSRPVAIRKLVNGAEVSFRRFVWCGRQLCEERDASGANVTKRFFAQGVQLATGPNSGTYYYTRDHLGSIREISDSGGVVRARYSYDPFGRQSKVSGDLDADFGFAGMLFSREVGCCLTDFRAYDPNLGRWLSRDPLRRAEIRQGPNLYAYVFNNPVSLIDPIGLAPLPPLPPVAPYVPVAPPGPVLAPPAVPQPALTQLVSTTDPDVAAREIFKDALEKIPSELAEGEGEVCVFFEDVSVVGGGTIAAAGIASAVVGVGIGLALDHYANADGLAANDGRRVEDATGSGFLGGVVTLYSAANVRVPLALTPVGWIGQAIFGD